MKKRVLLGMSGGVDSSVAAILLKEQGYEVVGITMNLWNNKKAGEEEISSSAFDAKKVCEKLGIEHYIVDMQNNFNTNVIDYFCKCYSECKTPNPCIECNKYLKFGAMYEKAKELECDYIATGHYAKIEYDEKYNKYVLKKSNAGRKDQSYVLYSIDKDLLDKIIFPLNEFEDKTQIRKIAEEHGLQIANKPDSEDICFIPDGDYKKFLEENSDIKQAPGNIVHIDRRVLGKHTGLYNYTIGQRKGLGISNPVPLFVVGFDKERNEVIVGESDKLFSKELYVEDINLLLLDEITEKTEVMAKVRYSAKEAKAFIYPMENGKMKVEFEEFQRAITPGQSVVFYIDDIVLGGGKIV